MSFRKDITGKRSGKLLILGYSHNENNVSKWIAKCDCGNEVVLDIRNFNQGASTSCGCNRKGHRTPNVGHPLYKVWLSLRNRCNNPKANNYHNYGGKGIKCCELWNNYEIFYSDVIDGYETGLSLDRFPNRDGNYDPSNFRWATDAQQVQNSSKAKLTETDVVNIRKSVEGSNTLATIYNVGRDTIWSIRAKKSWKNI